MQENDRSPCTHVHAYTLQASEGSRIRSRFRASNHSSVPNSSSGHLIALRANDPTTCAIKAPISAPDSTVARFVTERKLREPARS